MSSQEGSSTADPALVARAVAGDDEAFSALVAPCRRSVFRHCYRMLGSGVDAEDATQDAIERSWRRLATYDGSGPFPAWLHRIATNVCLDRLRTTRARPAGVSSVEPVGDAELLGPPDPQDEAVRREEISLAFVVVLQLLPPRQRAALLLNDVLGFTQAEVGEVLDIGVGAVNSLLSRARVTVRSAAAAPRPDITDVRVQLLLRRYLRAWELADVAALVDLVVEDVQFSMPPSTLWFRGREAVIGFVDSAIFAPSGGRGVPVLAGSCNGQLAVATYEHTNGVLAVSGIQLLQLAYAGGDPLITAIVSYRDAALAVRCGLPATHPGPTSAA